MIDRGQHDLLCIFAVGLRTYQCGSAQPSAEAATVGSGKECLQKIAERTVVFRLAEKAIGHLVAVGVVDAGFSLELAKIQIAAIDVQTGQSDTGVKLLLSNGSSVMVKSGTHVSADSKSKLP